ncbi:hypothetical protein [Paenibacillus pabuli]|uniref:hypothetical protein n=1 Tax=Paenibacillus pabuli TaxID=1472 RepID=UPI00200035A7|nr:hypothetical protein [Paenibacillus pabuli]UPK45938.1 hypothetical protein KET34_11010 [Paenibacillus pabuli]
MSKQEEIKQALTASEQECDRLDEELTDRRLRIESLYADKTLLLDQAKEHAELIEQQSAEMNRLQQLVNKQGKELEEARKVIGWYGDNGNYVQVFGLGGDPMGGYFCMPMVLTDHGERARLYLGQEGEGNQDESK